MKPNRLTPPRITRPLLAGLALFTLSAQAQPIDAELRTKARDTADRAIEYLRGQQDPVTGGWNHRQPAENQPADNLPAITALVCNGMLLDPRLDASDPAARRGIDYVLSFTQPDGGIYDRILPSYNTSISLSMLALAGLPETARAIDRARPFLIGLQFDESFDGSPESPDFNEPVPPGHPYFGGVGYGKHSRPDLSNLGFFVQALHDTGLATTDPAYEKAVAFLSRVQMLDETNDQPYADGSAQGGFVYATTPNADSVDEFVGQSQAGYFEEAVGVGENVRTLTRLRAYGSMTYVGFKSLIYADLSPSDPRVVAARRWIERNYTLAENPGLGPQGQYYYYAALARALDAWGEPTIAGENWREGLIETLIELQEPDGSFRVLHERWMEGDEVLITAFALIALQTAMN
ncbi:MAG: squalene-hopene/tetraprenyl-beta-curcumene cyclase [Phycisphaerales bacterium]|jgi:squalene-hopene/tetraprenyl-beta-curcumene cyclase